ncbi:hypothetical protein APSETT444_005377 [Aspergillus pseudonomiae]
MSGSNSLMRLAKRSRASDAAQNKLICTEGERVKRRRTSRDKDEIKQSLGPTISNVSKEMNDPHQIEHVANSSSLHNIDQDKIATPKPWSLSTPVAGQYTNIDPILTCDEEYLFVGLEAAVHVYSVATSRLFRTLQLKPNQSIIGYSLSSANQEHLYIITSAGSVSKWDWLSGKQVSHWTMGRKIISVSPSFNVNEGEVDCALLILRDHKAGKREIVVAHLSEKNLHETVILETSSRLDHIKCISNGQAVIAYSGQRVLIGTQGLGQNALELMQYTWREVALPVNISCVDIRHSTTSSRVEGQSSNNKKGPIGIDLALGSSDGSILTYDIHSNNHISRQALARTNATTLKISPEGSQIAAPNVTHLGVSHDGKWMSTVDKWSPKPHDIEALDYNGTGMRSITADYQEIFLKFWRWSKSAGMWELVTRVDGPHSSGKSPVPVLDLASRPASHEFATIGSNAVLRLWCPSSRQRSGLKMEHGEEQLETWKCRNTVDLKGYVNGENLDSVSMASIAFSQDGSVLAVCLQSVHPGSPGIAVLVDVQSCTVRYSRTGLYPGDPCVARFLGCHLVIASTQSVSVWDTVDDIVRTPRNLDVDYSYGEKAYRLLAVDPNTQTFAVTAQHPQSPTAPKKGRKHFVQVYDVQSLSLLGQLPLGRGAHALLPDSRSGDYIVLDVAANVQRLGYSKKTSQALPSQDWADKVNSGLAGLLGNSVYGTKYQHPSQTPMDGLEASPPQNKELAGIFNDSPFVLPSATVLFQDVVQALTG